MNEALDDADFRALTDKIAREREFRCDSYKEKCLRRRIAVRMRARAVHTYPAYAALLDRDAAEWDKLLDALTINVTKLFRNWETYDAVARHVVPELWQQSAAPIRVWSAGCSSGEEPYSLAALFYRHAESERQLDRLTRVHILGTDIDRGSLAAAQRATFEEDAFTDTPGDIRELYFTAGFPASPIPPIRALVAFERRDLLLEEPPPGRHQLVVCRNVLIYFDRATQEMVFERFHDALAPGGLLVLGKVETLLGPARARFAPLDPRERIYRKL